LYGFFELMSRGNIHQHPSQGHLNSASLTKCWMMPLSKKKRKKESKKERAR
jgi:hypothetical protein